MKRQALPGSKEALEDFRVARSNLYITCRTMKALISNAEYLVRQSKKYGSTSNFARSLEDTAVDISMTLQKATMAVNCARLAIRQFIEVAGKKNESEY